MGDWISVDDQPVPQDGEDYLIAWDDDDIVDTVCYDKDSPFEATAPWFSYTDNGYENGKKYKWWQPLPKHPEVG